MLAQIGSVQFTVAPFNMNEVNHEAGAAYASHEVIGRMPVLEFVGEAPETWSIRGSIFPQELRPEVGGGLNELDMLHAMRRSGSPQFFMRGDGVPMGWVVIEHVRERSGYLDSSGVGRVIDFDIQLKRADSPSSSGAFNALSFLFQ
jgi:phage protein U